jgi:hypothetical protein
MKVDLSETAKLEDNTLAMSQMIRDLKDCGFEADFTYESGEFTLVIRKNFPKLKIRL